MYIIIIHCLIQSVWSCLFWGNTSRDNVCRVSCHMDRAFMDPVKELDKFSGISNLMGYVYMRER